RANRDLGVKRLRPGHGSGAAPGRGRARYGVVLALLWALPVAAWAQTAPASATGTSEDGPAEAYRRAQAAFEELDLPRALAILDAALGASAAQGHALERAALLAFKAGVLHAQDAAPQEAVANLLHEAVRLDPYIEVPIEMRTPELAAMLEQARSGVARPPPGVRLEVSPAQAGEPLRIAARLDLELPP